MIAVPAAMYSPPPWWPWLSRTSVSVMLSVPLCSRIAPPVRLFEFASRMLWSSVTEPPRCRSAAPPVMSGVDARVIARCEMVTGLAAAATSNTRLPNASMVALGCAVAGPEIVTVSVIWG